MQPTFQAADRLGLPADLFAGKVAVVTGGGRGIGRETVFALAQLGARVVIAEVSESGAEVEALARQTGGEVTFLRTDVSAPASVEALAARVQALYGPADLLINNAIAIGVHLVTEMPVDFWDHVMAVNLRGTFLTCKAFLPGMLARGSGTILNMVSLEGMPGLSAYIASKQGLLGFSQSLAAEVGGQGVRVVAFAPGMVDTPGLRGVSEPLAPHLGMSAEQFMTTSMHPEYPGLMPVADAAAATVYLAARLADEYHGQSVDGYTILEQAGYLRPAAALLDSTPTGPAAPVSPPAPELLPLARQFLAQLEATDAEFNRLPVFIRPMARSGFRGKSGKSIQEWTRLAHALVDRPDLSPLDWAGSAWQADLDKLSGYFHDVPAETARFTRDSAMLAEVQRISLERIALIDALRATLMKRV